MPAKELSEPIWKDPQIVVLPDPNAKRARITLTTKDGTVIKRFVDNIAEDVPPPPDPNRPLVIINREVIIHGDFR